MKTVYFGGGSPTILNRNDLQELVGKLKDNFDFSKVNEFTIETDPRRVDEDRLLFNSKACGANRISFGMQDFDDEVQRRVNRVQPFELFEKLLKFVIVSKKLNLFRALYCIVIPVSNIFSV